jgi:hypothetical protein
VEAQEGEVRPPAYSPAITTKGQVGIFAGQSIVQHALAQKLPVIKHPLPLFPYFLADQAIIGIGC